jgi:hypothetical protein
MIEIKELPCDINDEEEMRRDHNSLKTVASARTHKQTLGYLLDAINGDFVDIENCYLIMVETND